MFLRLTVGSYPDRSEEWCKSRAASWLCGSEFIQDSQSLG
jgi:hypothetical protein